MENKLSKAQELRIKSPQLYQAGAAVNQAPSAPPLHSGAGDRSELRSAEGGGAGASEVLCRCGHPRSAHDFHETTLSLPCFALVLGKDCPCAAFRARPSVVEASRPEAEGGSGAEPPRMLLAEMQPISGSIEQQLARCSCGAAWGDHLTARPLAGAWCILRANARTRKVPGVRPIVAVLS